MKNASLYANETLTSFFRRLTFTPDGSLLLTPAGQYQTQHQVEGAKPTYEVINTVYIYTRGGINKPPIAHLPGHKKPSVAVRCSPVVYTLRQSPPTTKHITIDTSSAEEAIPSLPEPLSRPSPAPSVMDPPPPPAVTDSSGSTSKSPNLETSVQGQGPKSVFALPYRMVYAVATQDSVLLYDTQQHTPICVVSNLHCATFTDLTW
jgi:chromatin assembly factor 1 subunit B